MLLVVPPVVLLRMMLVVPARMVSMVSRAAGVDPVSGLRVVATCVMTICVTADVLAMRARSVAAMTDSLRVAVFDLLAVVAAVDLGVNGAGEDRGDEERRRNDDGEGETNGRSFRLGGVRSIGQQAGKAQEYSVCGGREFPRLRPRGVDGLLASPFPLV